MDINFANRTKLAGAALLIGAVGFTGVAGAQGYGNQSEAEPVSAEAAEDLLAFQDIAEDDTVDTDTVDTDTVDANTADADASEDGTQGDNNNNRRRGNRGRRGAKLSTAADAIGIETDALREALSEDQTIADVAEANGVDSQTVIDAMVDAKAERLAEKVEAGRITQEEADEKLASKTERIEDKVNGVEETAGVTVID